MEIYNNIIDLEEESEDEAESEEDTEESDKESVDKKMIKFLEKKKCRTHILHQHLDFQNENFHP